MQIAAASDKEGGRDDADSGLGRVVHAVIPYRPGVLDLQRADVTAHCPAFRDARRLRVLFHG